MSCSLKHDDIIFKSIKTYISDSRAVIFIQTFNLVYYMIYLKVINTGNHLRINKYRWSCPERPSESSVTLILERQNLKGLITPYCGKLST